MSNDTPTTKAKRKQVWLAVAIIAGILFLSGVGVYLTQDVAPPQDVTRVDNVTTKSYIAPGDKIDPQDAWRGSLIQGSIRWKVKCPR